MGSIQGMMSTVNSWANSPFAQMGSELGLPGNALQAGIGEQLAALPQQFLDAFQGLGMLDPKSMLGGAMAPQCFTPRPGRAMAKSRAHCGQSYCTAMGDANSGQSQRIQLGGSGFLGRMLGRSLEKALKENPELKAKMEGILGGRIIEDGRNDGRITVQRDKGANLEEQGENGISKAVSQGLMGILKRFENMLDSEMGTKTKDSGCSSGGCNSAQATGSSSGTDSASASGEEGLLADSETAELAKGMGMSPPLSFEDCCF